tara:strand:+ start:3454 stop:4449 length:996 start_codon:yes stop_codon:yes gene_type:complete
MEFFNKKEEVIDLKLTQFGRYMLSKGKFKPVFYSFHDDNILYDSQKAGFVETQNDSEARIATTPTMHHQVALSSLEKEFNNNYNKVLSGEVTATSEDIQRTAEKQYILSQPIGTSDINSEYSPSWTIQFLNGTLSGSVGFLNLPEKTGGANTQLVPQIDSVLEVKVSEISESSEDLGLEEAEDGLLQSNISIVSDDDELYFLLKVAENNGLFQKKNFDVELFEIQEETQGSTTIETLRPLMHFAPLETTTGVSFVDDITPDSDTTHVEYYFDLLVDDEINDEILCKFDPINENMGVYADPRTKLCQDVVNKQKKKVFDIYEDESDYPGEIC